MENQNKVRADLRQLKPFFIVAFVGIIYHLRIRPMAGDDVFFAGNVRAWIVELSDTAL